MNGFFKAKIKKTNKEIVLEEVGSRVTQSYYFIDRKGNQYKREEFEVIDKDIELKYDKGERYNKFI